VAVLLSVNAGRAAPNPYKRVRSTGIGKTPQPGPVQLSAPGPSDSGVAGDYIGDKRNPGGPDQAVYAVAREDLDYWQGELGRELRNGWFGENLSTRDLDVNGALIGEQWRIGAANGTDSTGAADDAVVLQVTVPRLPCATFNGWMQEPGWLKTFTRAARPGAYLKVVRAGAVRAGDEIEIVHRPVHDVSIALVFRALTLEAGLLPQLLDASEDLPADVVAAVRRHLSARR
jgi:MOSC domain-containing protein YiiM